MRLFCTITACVLVSQIVSCDKSRDTADNETNQTSHKEHAPPSKDGRTESHPTLAKNLPGASLSQGTLTVFGLTLPTGMTPQAGPDKVYRFESAHPTEMMFKNIERQVSSKRIGPERNGYLIREASVRNPKGNATGKEVIALRIKKKEGGGSIVDIWLEHSYVRQLQGSSSGQMASHAKEKPKATRAGTTWKKRTRESRRDTLRVMGKVSRKQNLTKEELRSSAFH